jgi:translation initiation factor IF-3
MDRDAALSLAGDQNLDLVEVGMQEGLPLVKIIDYGKFLFKQQKQQSQNKSSTKKTELKTMKLTYKIGDHDVEVRRKQAEKWAKE